MNYIMKQDNFEEQIYYFMKKTLSHS